jgi:hypothetical protein
MRGDESISIIFSHASGRLEAYEGNRRYQGRFQRDESVVTECQHWAMGCKEDWTNRVDRSRVCRGHWWLHGVGGSTILDINSELDHPLEDGTPGPEGNGVERELSTRNRSLLVLE